MGGTNRKETGKASNGIYVHLKCHSNVESNRNDAVRNGWLVSQTDEPADIPVVLYYGTVLLRDDGSVDEVREVEELLDPGGDER